MDEVEKVLLHTYATSAKAAAAAAAGESASLAAEIRAGTDAMVRHARAARAPLAAARLAAGGPPAATRALPPPRPRRSKLCSTRTCGLATSLRCTA
jgi:hypothetical protein